jgi:hypothetical protein
MIFTASVWNILVTPSYKEEKKTAQRNRMCVYSINAENLVHVSAHVPVPVLFMFMFLFMFLYVGHTV